MNSNVNRILLATALLGTFFAGTATRIFNISMPTVAAALDTDLLGFTSAMRGEKQTAVRPVYD